MYQELDKESCLDYVREKNIFKDSSNLICEEVGNGNLNLVFRVINNKEKSSVIIKQALPYLKVAGASWPLSLDRNRLEYCSIEFQTQNCAEFTPKVYQHDEDNALFIMEDYGHMMILRDGLINMETYPDLSNQIGTYLAKTLFYTSDFGLDQKIKDKKVANFINPELCAITERLVFTEPYYNAESNDINNEIKDTVKDIWSRQDIIAEIYKLKCLFMNKKEALIHGDLHTGSIFVTKDTCKVFDSEFTFYGPISFDIGVLFANFILNYAYWEIQKDFSVDSINTYRKYLLDSIEEVWIKFQSEFIKIYYNQRKINMLTSERFATYMKDIFQETIGFCSCEIMRRVIGLAHVPELDTIADKRQRAVVERKSLEIAINILGNKDKLSNIKDFIKLIDTNQDIEEEMELGQIAITSY